MAIIHEPVVLARDDLANEQTLRYARGFVVSDAEPVAPAHWSAIRLGTRWSARWDPRNLVTHAKAGGVEVLVIGRIAHVDAPRESSADIADRLAAALSTTRDAYQEEVDGLLGRFALLAVVDDELYVQSDAAGTRAVAFSSIAPRVAASHTRLVAENIGVRASELAYPRYFRDNGMFQFPGRWTEYESVLSLTPNTELRVADGSVERIFPRAPIEACSLEEAVAAVLEAGDALAAALQHEPRILLSLSAGVDSRSTLAMLRELAPRLELFTYDLTYATKNAGNRHDREAAESLATRFSLRHMTLAVDERDPAGALRTVLHEVTRATNSRRLARTYAEELPVDAVHLRSHVHGIAKGHYQQFNYGKRTFDGATLAFIASAGKATDARITEAFEAFRAETQFDRRFDYDPLDLLYWEYRAALIQAPAILESDLVVDTISPLSCRRLLAKLLGVPIAHRKRAEIFLGVMRQRWPELLEVPVNGRDIDAEGYR